VYRTSVLRRSPRETTRPVRDQGFFGRLFRSRRAPAVFLALLLVFLVIIYAVVLDQIRPHTPGRELTLNQLLERVRDRKITEVTLLSEDSRLVGTDEEGQWWVGLGPGGSDNSSEFVTSRLLNNFLDIGIETRIDTQVSKGLLKLATQFLLPALTLAVMFALLYTLRRGGREGGEYALLGKSGARQYAAGRRPDVTFADVAGVSEAIEELREIKDFLASPETFERMGAKPPRGVLLMGPPGCGKTLLAKAVAGEAGVPFFSVSASEFGGMLVGVGPSRVRDLFSKARAAAPAIIFIDEVDAVGRARSAGETINPEGESTLNELLVQLDGFDPANRIVLMAATNRPDVLDEALMRKGRFDRHIVIDVPDLAGRLAILKVHARGKPLDPSVDLERLARRTVGFSGADLAATINEAATLAARRRLRSIGNREVGEAVDRVIAGPERLSRILSPDEKRRIAYHEAGHALVGWVFSSTTTVDKVSVVARGHMLGGTWRLPVEDRHTRTRSQMEEEIAALLAGRTAEDIVFGDLSGASQHDLTQAGHLARQMVYQLGMSPSLGPLVLGVDGMPHGQHSQEVSTEADREVRRFLDLGDKRARLVLTTYRQRLDQLAGTLVAQETLERQDLENLLGDLPQGLPPDGTTTRLAARRTASG
jgi:cell division protease FtsH